MFELMTSFSALNTALAEKEKTSTRWEPKPGSHIVRLVPYVGTATSVILTKLHYVGQRDHGFSAMACPKKTRDPVWDFANAMRSALPPELNKALFSAFGLSRARALIQVAVYGEDGEPVPLIWGASQEVTNTLEAIEAQIAREQDGTTILDYPLAIGVTQSRAQFGSRPVNQFTIAAGRKPAPRPAVTARSFESLLASAPPRADSPEIAEKLRAYVREVILPACRREGADTAWTAPWAGEEIPF
jgi:hypothetical protein